MKNILKAVKKVLKSRNVDKKETKAVLIALEATILKMVQEKRSPEYIQDTVTEIIDYVIENKGTILNKQKKTKKTQEKFTQINDNDITYFKDGGDKFFQVGKDLVVKRYFLPANEFLDQKGREDEGFCFVVVTKKDEKRFLKIAQRQNLNIFRVDMMMLDDFVQEEMRSYSNMDFTDKPGKPLNILSKKCVGTADMAKKKKKNVRK